MRASGTDNSELVQMADILPPAVSVAETSIAGIYLLLFLLVAAITVLGFRYRNSSKRRLVRLRKRYLQHKIGKRQCALQLKRQLYENSSPPSVYARQQERDWQEYLTTLQAACYGRRRPDDRAMLQLLSGAERWL